MRYDSSSVLKLFFALIILMQSFASCNKNIDSTSNKAYLSATNLSPNAVPLKIVFETDTLNAASGPLPFDSTTGIPGNPYLLAFAGVHPLKIIGDTTYVMGNIALQANHYYSLFVYDSVGKGLSTLILQDVLNPLPDTIASVRFLNFSSNAPSVYVQLNGIYNRDTFPLIVPPFDYVGNNHSPSDLSNQTFIKPGIYQILATIDGTSYYLLDTLTFANAKIYTIYTKNPLDSTIVNSLGVIHHN